MLNADYELSNTDGEKGQPFIKDDVLVEILKVYIPKASISTSTKLHYYITDDACAYFVPHRIYHYHVQPRNSSNIS